MKKIAFFLLLNCPVFAQKTGWAILPPAGDLPVKIERGGLTVIPNGRFVTPLGRQIETAPHPYGLAVSGDGVLAVTANSGTAPFSISIVHHPFSEKTRVKQIPDGPASDAGILEACFMGLAVAPDNKTIFVSGGEANKILLFDAATGKPTGNIDCKTTGHNHGYLGDLTLSEDGKTLFVVDQIGFRLIGIDISRRPDGQVSGKTNWEVPTGRYPFGICLSPDGRRVFVANVGQFEYNHFSDFDPKRATATAHDWPASSYGTEKAAMGDPEKGIPPLGGPNSPDGFSVWSFDLPGNGKPPILRKKIKTGILVGQMVEDFPAVGGSSPNSVVATETEVFVSNATNDCVSVISIEKDTVVATISLQPDERLGNLRGIIPFGLALSPDRKRLFVAESGINAVAVVDVATKKVVGHLPVGWFPSKIKVSPDGKKLIVANAKGYGSGPNGGPAFTLDARGSYIGNRMNGTLSVFEIPEDSAFARLTRQVLDNNFVFVEKKSGPAAVGPIPFFAEQQEPPIKYWVFIAKENRTYDEIFGQLKNGNGEPSLARFGENQPVSDEKGRKKLENIDIAPNHLALARRFSMADNFYCDSDVSADGHRWLVNTYPNEWCETATAAHYGGHFNRRDSSDAPGNLAIYGSAGSIYPEDYNEGGSVWEHLERHGIDYFNFGFGVEMAGAISDTTMKYAGEKYTVNYPLPGNLINKSSRQFPTYNMAIPDQFRTDIFMKEFNEKWAAPHKALPPVLFLMLPNDHTTGPRPKAGIPFRERYMADNDLALGRAVEFLSRTPFWKNMAIVITEDDPQGGVDHVDAHRSICMVVSPWAKRGFIGHQHYSFGSIFKTFWNALGIPCLNQYDAGAANLGDLFSQTPDYQPFTARPIDPRLFDPQTALDPFDEKFNWKALKESPELDDVNDMVRDREREDGKVFRKRKWRFWNSKRAGEGN